MHFVILLLAVLDSTKCVPIDCETKEIEVPQEECVVECEPSVVKEICNKINVKTCAEEENEECEEECENITRTVLIELEEVTVEEVECNFVKTICEEVEEENCEEECVSSVFTEHRVICGIKSQEEF